MPWAMARPPPGARFLILDHILTNKYRQNGLT